MTPTPNTSPRQLLRHVFGFDHFRGQQETIINNVVAGQDALVLMPTGGGKSLCYQLAALARDGVGIVVSPLIALMADQVAALEQIGVRAAYLNSTQDINTQRSVRQQLINGSLDLLYIAPERLLQPRTQALLTQCDIALFAIDEAHCVSQWGHDFRPEYMRLSQLSQQFPNVPRMALTATADPDTQTEIHQRLALRGETFIHNFDRPNIRYRVAERQNGTKQILAFLRDEHAGDSGIVYCLSRKKVEKTAAMLTEEGFTALPYHAGLDHKTRDQHQRRFLRESGIIIVATIAFGMGIDKPDVRFVAHLDMPASIEAYYQETGRAGRDGQAADAWMLYGLGDVVTRRRMIDESDAADARKRVEQQKLDAMLVYCEAIQCRRSQLLHYFGQTTSANCHNCHNCDNCQTPPDIWDATHAARKLLSAVYRTGQRFGAQYMTQHLRGEADERAQRLRHNQLSTFGIGQSLTVKRWRSVIRQLTARGYLTPNDHGGLQLTEDARPLLRGEETLELRLPARRGKTTSNSRNRPRIKVAAEDGDLWDTLRELRTELASEQGVPSYVIFNDATLAEMVNEKPATIDAFLALNGVGEKKLEAYGDLFMTAIANHATGQAVSD